MAEIDWSGMEQSFERYPALSLENGQSKTITLKDDGSFVSKVTLKQAKSKFPRDSYVFLIEDGRELKEFWLSAKSFSVMSQLKAVREKHSNNLKDVPIKITRISDNPKETNYKIEEI